MLWGAPEYGWFALLVIPLIFIGRFANRIRQENLSRLGCFAENPKSALVMVRRVLNVVAFLLIVVTLCRPQWGTQPEIIDSKGIDIVVALDTSRSMLADDLPPTRLETAKKAINALVGKLHGDRIGLIAFAGSAFLVCPLTSDYDAFLQVLNESGSDTIPRGGTDFSALAKEVQNAFSGTDLHSRLLIVVSDGEDHGGFDVTSSRQLRESGMMICSITAGTEKGGIIPLPGGNFLKDRQGSLIHSRANPVTMDYFSSRNMKLEADGGTAIRLYDEVRPLLLQHTIKNSRQRYKERFQIPLAAALLLLCTEAFLACRVRI